MQTIKKKAYATKRNQAEQELLTLAHKVSAVTTKYRQQLYIAGVVIVAVIVLVVGYNIRKNQQEQQASPLVASAYEYYNPEGGGKADYQKALDMFRDVQKRFPGTMSGSIAQYYVGNCLVNLGRPEEALKEYQTFVKDYSGEKFILGLVYQRVGSLYQSMGKTDEALKAFELSESLNGPGLATVELARLYESAGNIPESQKKYKIVAEVLAGTTWGMEAMGKVQKIAPAQKPAAAAAAK